MLKKKDSGYACNSRYLCPVPIISRKYPVLSDVAGEARKAYGVGKGLLGLVNARVTFVIGADGIVQYVSVLFDTRRG